MENSLKIADIIVKKIKGTISTSEQVTLDNWINESSENNSIYEKAISSKAHLAKLEIYDLFEKNTAWAKLEKDVFKGKSIPLNPRRWMLYAAAILVPILISISAIFYFDQAETTTLSNIDTLITPGTQKAVLVLSNGGTVALDKEVSFNEINEEDVEITNKNNSLTYSSEKKRGKIKELVYNFLKTPRGGGYNLILADGTQVWLNAGSSLKFPVDFTDSTRRVYLEGEAYFEVSHNGKPFIVNADKMDVRVLGTSFNVSAYADEQEIKTTLVEGRVRIEIPAEDKSETSTKILTPNNQAIVKRSDTEITLIQVNASQYTSWIEGKLEFNNEDLDLVMKSLARWYDFEYEFENIAAKDYHFSARINNTESISNILEMLEMTTNVKFEIRKNTIVIN